MVTTVQKNKQKKLVTFACFACDVSNYTGGWGPSKMILSKALAKVPGGLNSSCHEFSPCPLCRQDFLLNQRGKLHVNVLYILKGRLYGGV